MNTIQSARGSNTGESNLEVLQKKKDTIAKEYSKTDVKFQQSTGEKVEEEFKSYTVGLSTREEFKRKHDNIISLMQEKQEHEMEAQELKQKQMVKKRKQAYKKKQQVLSFADDEEEEDQEEENNNNDNISVNKKRKQEELNENQNQNQDNNKEEKKIKKIEDMDEGEIGDKLQKKILIGKNPNANTEFLPDIKRDQLNILKKEKLKLEYLQRKEKLENQFVEVKFSYWDGFKVVKTIRVKQKTSILGLIDSCRKQLLQEYPNLNKVKPIDLIAVARDHVLSSKMTFYEIIESKLTNKKGQLIFDFQDRDEKDPLGKEIVVGYDENTVIMIIEKKVTEKQGDNPLYFFLKDSQQ